MQRFRKTESNMVAVVQLVRASDCGSECRRFESDQPPTKNRSLATPVFIIPKPGHQSGSWISAAQLQKFFRGTKKERENDLTPKSWTD